MLFLLLFTNLFYADPAWTQSRYPIEKFRSKLFSDQDREMLKQYFADDYLVKKRTEEFALEGQHFFLFLSGSMAKDIREEVKRNPYHDLAWPDNLEFIELYLMDLEKENSK